MADIRIKDLTTTASSTASDDFIAVDGTTNGTRKLSAFSPTFGGNVVVTGTLTVNGGVTTINGNASGTTSYARLQNNGSNISLWGSRAAIDGGTATDVGLFVYGANELSFWTNSTRSAWISSGGVFNTVAGAAVGGALSVASTTVSTSTSSGALVVSGGVGVAKSVTVGENIDIGTGHGTKLYVNNSGAWASKELLVTGYDTLDYTQIKVVGNASNTASIKLDQNGLATISGAVRTAAPSGGTAANWKLGTVATVSPTSPNRTIEVDIGGTIYYIHAKTTNN